MSERSVWLRAARASVKDRAFWFEMAVIAWVLLVLGVITAKGFWWIAAGIVGVSVVLAGLATWALWWAEGKEGEGRDGTAGR